jgi:hypothetical protein
MPIESLDRPKESWSPIELWEDRLLYEAKGN